MGTRPTIIIVHVLDELGDFCVQEMFEFDKEGRETSVFHMLVAIRSSDRIISSDKDPKGTRE